MAIWRRMRRQLLPHHTLAKQPRQTKFTPHNAGRAPPPSLPPPPPSLSPLSLSPVSDSLCITISDFVAILADSISSHMAPAGSGGTPLHYLFYSISQAVYYNYPSYARKKQGSVKCLQRAWKTKNTEIVHDEQEDMIMNVKRLIYCRV